MRETISALVTDVRDGDDARIKVLLERLAEVAVTAGLLRLHHRLSEALHEPGARPPH
ncbi:MULTISPECIES: hypothetical protein [unclassified Streptomyces]|uniref:hypothetical protein n=1 Tax=unclassified Streptomyces TaxID=2593676 RepID=UPI00344C9AB8